MGWRRGEGVSGQMEDLLTDNITCLIKSTLRWRPAQHTKSLSATQIRAFPTFNHACEGHKQGSSE